MAANHKLRALQTVVVGRNEYVYPDRGNESIFECDSKTAQELIQIGAAEVFHNASAKAELPAADADAGTAEMVGNLKVEELQLGLEYLNVDYDEKARKPDLKKQFLAACKVNPIKASMFFDELKGQ